MPKDLEALWPMLLERYPAHLRTQHAAAMGVAFCELMKALKKDLGRSFGSHPREGQGRRASTASVGDPAAFARFVRKQLADLVGRISL